MNDSGNGQVHVPTRRIHPVFVEILNSVRSADGESIEVRTPLAAVRLDTSHARTHGRLRKALYEAWHCGRVLDVGDVDPDEGFLRRLASSVAHTGSVDKGWELLPGRGRDGNRLVRKAGVTITVGGESIRFPPGGHRGRVDEVSVVLPPCRPNLSPGYFSVIASRGAPLTVDVRLYVNLPPTAAPQFLHRATHVLESGGLRYALKTLSDPNAYGRRDGTVAYLDAADADTGIDLLGGALAETLGEAVRPVPPLCAEVRTGVGVAWEPRADSRVELSFGEHRFGAVASFLLDCVSRTEQPTTEGLGDYLAAEGIDPAQPHLNLDPGAGMPIYTPAPRAPKSHEED
ncbi:T3SS effector HopA1 family protein [Nocardiopsis rhodophaea]|uniref:T3SS effector HopA1 family protein n=1 Tax=Nocardiopsis rhodophaea TaxID=280238 RepID=UPI0031D6DB92